MCLKLTNFVVDAIIFLAPISAFDQVLTEDPQVNRLVRSFHLSSQFCWLSRESHIRRIRCYYGRDFAKTSCWLKSTSCCSLTNAISSNASSSLAFVFHDISRVMTTGQMIWIQLPSVRPSLPITLVPIVNCIRNTRLPRKIQRYTKNVFASTPEVLWLLHIYHREIYFIDYPTRHYLLIESTVGDYDNGWHPSKRYVFTGHLTTGHIVDRLVVRDIVLRQNLRSVKLA